MEEVTELLRSIDNHLLWIVRCLFFGVGAAFGSAICRAIFKHKPLEDET